MKTTIHFRIALGTIVAITLMSCQSEVSNENAAYERYKQNRLKLNDTTNVQDIPAVAVATVLEPTSKSKSLKHKKATDWTRVKLKFGKKKEKK